MAELLAAKAFRVVLLARRRARVVALCEQLSTRWDVQAEPLVTDLADPGAPAAVVAELGESGRRVDLLVNNAGFTQIGRYDELSWPDHERQLRVTGIVP